MRHVVLDLNMPTVNGTAGTSRDIRDLREGTVFIHGTGTFSVKVQGKISGHAAPTVVPAGNPSQVAPPTTTKPAADVPASGPDNNDDWVDISGSITTTSLVALGDAAGNPYALTHVRIFGTTLTNAPKACVGGRDARTK